MTTRIVAASALLGLIASTGSAAGPNLFDLADSFEVEMRGASAPFKEGTPHKLVDLLRYRAYKITCPDCARSYELLDHMTESERAFLRRANALLSREVPRSMSMKQLHAFAESERAAILEDCEFLGCEPMRVHVRIRFERLHPGEKRESAMLDYCVEPLRPHKRKAGKPWVHPLPPPRIAP